MMKKIVLIFSIIAVIVITFLFGSSLNRNNEIEQISIGQSFCNSLLSDMSNGEITVETKAVNKSIIDEYITKIAFTDSEIINLTSYFSFLELENGYDASNPEDSEYSKLTPEELADFQKRMEEYIESFEEDENIFINSNGEKCIKVNDLHRLDNMDATVKYFDGEYIIPKEDIPITLSFLKENAFFDFNLLEVVEKDKNILSFKYENTSNNYPSIFIFDIYFKGNNVENFVLTINGYNPFNY